MSFDLTIEPLGQTVEVEEGQTLLDAALRAGIYLPHACGHGLCGTCKVEVLDGEIDHGEASSFALMDYEREEGFCLACVARPECDITIEADVDEEPDALHLPIRDVVAVVTRIEDLTPTIKGVFAEVQGEPLEFQAGQYLNVHLPNGDGHRPFSFANAPADAGEIELDVRLVPGGKATTWIHQELRVGDEIKVTGPYGRFFVRRSAQVPMLFLAGGSGLSSPRSMIAEQFAAGSSVPMTLVHGVRTRAELYYEDEFRALANDHDHFTYLPVLSHEAEGSDWEGARGFVHEAAAAHFANDFRGMKAYLCGPPLMIDACLTTLMQGRLFERDIYMERFISAADTQTARSPLFKRI